MSEAVIVALITGGLSLLGTILAGRRTDEKVMAEIRRQSETSDEKIRGELNVVKADVRTLSNRVDKHNNVLERTYELERRMDVQEEKTKVANHRIDDLERKD